MSIEVVLTIIALGVVATLAGLAWLHGHKSGVESAIARATTIPNGVAQKLDAVVPGASAALQNASSAAGNAVTSAADKV